MIYLKHQPSRQLQQWIECYWLIDSEGDRTISEEKIIPDGFPESIWHYGDAYEINISGEWKIQSRALLAGQLTNHFYLRNTGVSGMIGIKWRPYALHHLFNTNMSSLVDAVIDLPESLQALSAFFENESELQPTIETLEKLDEYLVNHLPFDESEPRVSGPVMRILESRGKAEIDQLAELAGLSSRSLERQFRQVIGLSPKFYSRIIRLSHVFEMVQSGNRNWSDIVYESGYYDQSHFIKNFKEFIGEDPSSYGFDALNMANFHLRKEGL